jgi:EAL domain-containing protein (putative c-di-GMP-specific phosphodiesterase class I)
MQDQLLVIDDDGGFRNYVRRIAEDSGFDTTVTGDVKAFREQIRTSAPTVIVMDLNMPNADGIELMRELATVKSTAKILLVSGVDTKVLDAARRFGTERGLTIAGALQKPIRAALLRDTLACLRELDKPLLASGLAHAIRNDDLILEYQPRLDCSKSIITGVEALVRWHHPTRGILPPDQFISLAEQSGLCHDLAEWVATVAAKQGAAWRKEGMPLDMAINVSARNLERIDLPDMLVGCCEQAGFPPEGLTIEVTESAAMSTSPQTIDVLTRLRLKGFRLSLDDFGTGYSCLSQLQRLPFSEIKVDKSFVMQMQRDPDSRVIVEMVIALGQKLRHAVVAEGVETPENLADLRTMGADAVQGYFVSPPVSADRIADILKRWPTIAPSTRAVILSASSRPRPSEPVADGPDRRDSDQYKPTKVRRVASD